MVVPIYNDSEQRENSLHSISFFSPFQYETFNRCHYPRQFTIIQRNENGYPNILLHTEKAIHSNLRKLTQLLHLSITHTCLMFKVPNTNRAMFNGDNTIFIHPDGKMILHKCTLIYVFLDLSRDF